MRERLLSKIVPEPNSGCWLWEGSIDRDGYGRHDRKMAHRVVYEAFVSPIPPGLTIDHLCRQRCCVNPAHLRPMTIGENTRRGWPAQKTHCKNGHPFDEHNTYLRKKEGRRDCRSCNREAVRRYKQRQAA